MVAAGMLSEERKEGFHKQRGNRFGRKKEFILASVIVPVGFK